MNIKVEIINNTQNIIIEKDGIQKTIYTLENGSNRHFCGYVQDKNYIIIYHDRRDQEGYRYKDVRFVYDINKDEEADLSQGTYSKLTNNILSGYKTYYDKFKKIMTSMSDKITVKEL